MGISAYQTPVTSEITIEGLCAETYVPNTSFRPYLSPYEYGLQISREFGVGPPGNAPP